jgi:hypothetical protein
VDTYGICAVAYVLLHGTYMETVLDKNTNRHKPKEPFKRYDKNKYLLNSNMNRM